MRYRTLLFDLDGTLTDSQPGIFRCIRHALRQLDWPVPDDNVLQDFLGPPLDESFQTLCGMDEATARRAVTVYRERFSTVGLFENRVYDGMPALLGRLCGQDRRLVVATCKPEVFALRILQRFNLASFFDVIVGSGLDGSRAHKDAVIREALRQCGLEPGAPATVMVGDRRQDVEGARACGLPCIGAGYGYAAPGELETAGAHAVAATVDDLSRLLEA